MPTTVLKIKSTPYTYILEWTKLGKRYIGARWSKDCHPDDLWSHYFTSSTYVKQFIKIHGDPDIILIDKVFSNPSAASQREQYLLRKFDVIHNDTFLNKSLGGIYDYSDPEIIEKRAKNLEVRKELLNNVNFFLI